MKNINDFNDYINSLVSEFEGEVLFGGGYILITRTITTTRTNAQMVVSTLYITARRGI
jgi:hypothetical protein